MKKTILFLSLLFIFSGLNAFSFEYNVPICVKIEDEYVNLDKDPLLIDDRTYLPVRFFCESLSAIVDWEDRTKTVTVTKDDINLSFQVGSNTAYLNGKKTPVGAKAILIDDRTYLPMRFIAESMGGTVNWNDNYLTVEINNLTLSDDAKTGRNYTDDQVYWLAKIISSESENQPMRGKVAVGNVVMNRVSSSEYPNTIYSVIFDKTFGYQFSPVENGSIYKEPVKDAYIAAKLCLEGYNVIGDCKYFLNPDIAKSTWIPENKTYYTTIGDHDFYY